MRAKDICRTRVLNRVFIAFILVLSAGWTSAVLAQDIDTDGEEQPFNYCFATRLGSGVYDISGRIIQVYRIPLAKTIRDFEGRRYGLNFKAPVTLGFFDLADDDVAGSDLPENIGAAAVVPALEIPVRIMSNWYLAPTVGFGAGKDFAGGETSYIYQIALKSVASFQRREHALTLWNELAYLGHTVSGEEPNEDVALFESGLDVRRPLRYRFRGHETDIGLFVANYMYGEPTKYFLTEDATFEVRAQYEIGFTLGTREDIKLWKLPLPRMGLSYRFGDGVAAVRLVIGNPF